MSKFREGISEPRLLRWHFWAAAAVIIWRLQGRLGSIGRILDRPKWWAIAHANAAYPSADRKQTGLPF